MVRALLAAPLLLLALAACASGGGDYPSLAPRPIERRPDIVPERPAPVATPDAALDATLAEIDKNLTAAADAFAPTADRTRALVAAATKAGVGSDAWLDAQTALAELDGDRAQSTAALTRLDELAIARARALQPAYPALEALHDRGEAQVADESATIAGLQKQLPGS
jgi:hypothetical protein